ncbi:unnamed protein product [Paramecium primaurelia]|uniref:Transmembrane protein n=2 Tax=Paramecium TaxID=5884 RepID=A0A8S1UHW5_9CILI|nr:unnamed protein product [Paramecium primaurelia]CAD8164781.1 unnamed protein product [Paramecium pentaurelia]
MEIPLDRQQSLLCQIEYQKQFPLCEKTVYSLITIFYCISAVLIIQNYCIDPQCQTSQVFAETIVYLFVGAIILRLLIIIVLVISYMSQRALVTTIILEQKLNEAEFFITIVFMFFAIIFYIGAENCHKMQIGYAFVFILTYVIVRLMCLPNGVINYFDGEYF